MIELILGGVAATIISILLNAFWNLEKRINNQNQ